MNQWEQNSSLLEGNEAKEVIKKEWSWNGAFWRAFACPLHNGCLLSLLEPISRELDSFPSWLMERQLKNLNGGYLWCLVSCLSFIQLESSHLYPYSLIPSSPFPHTLMWWRTCWSGACTLMNLFDSKYWIHDVWICTIIYILYVIINIINPCVKGLHYHALE